MQPPPVPIADPLLASLPLGKYHPSNYPSRVKLPDQLGPQTHKRQKSDIKKKLQQYQRDMVEQATLAGRLAMPGNMKPVSPRLAPLLSPGPVTPMELEERDGYLGVKNVENVGAQDGVMNAQDMIQAMIREEEKRSPGVGVEVGR
jgi:hypothetical protein